jgi:outer membrane protein assembly factor BamB
MRRPVADAAAVTLAVTVAVLAASCGGAANRTPAQPAQLAAWPMPNGDLAGTRVAQSSIDSSNVGTLHVLWRFRLQAESTFSGLASATPLIVGSRVFVQDLDSNVFALDRGTGKLLWRRRFNRPSGGPNGVTYADGRIYGNTEIASFALDARSGRLLWLRSLTTARQPITIAPVVAGGLVVTSTTGAAPGGRGTIIALDASTGNVRWRFDTIARPWLHPRLANGGGAWYTPTVDAQGNVWAGTANPNPWGGSKAFPNGGMYPGPVRHTDSLIELDGTTGHLLWAEQVTPHDVRDYDFQDPPVLTGSTVVGAGKAGRVVAWDRATHRRLWSTPVGEHRNDVGPLPSAPTTVCPGLLGGVETPLAVAGGRVFVPVVDLCFTESALGTSLASFLTVDYTKARGALVALELGTGRLLWSHSLASADFGCATVSHDVVFTDTYAGTILALSAKDGRVLWHARTPAALNACPAVAGRLVVVAAAAAYPAPRAERYEVVAYAP